MAELAGRPERCAPSIHIAGSKGKGSVTCMITSILTAAGFRAARYMSPHVTDIRERICLGDSFFDEDVYCSAGNELRSIAEEKLPAENNPLFTSDSQGYEPTFWELLTLLFFLCARRAECDVMVVETGMGGRLDSTNILDPLVSVITLIELEHTNFLGNTITAIAGEKAGIIKPGKPLILAKQKDEALEVFRQKAQEKNSRLYYFPETGEISNVGITPQGTEFTFGALRLSIPVPGKVQAENAALAIAAVKTAFRPGTVTDDAIRRGLANVKMPARFEKLIPSGASAAPPFIIDGAHTPESFALCVETFCMLYGEGGVLIFGCAADKNAEAMAKTAHERFAKIIITTPGNFKASEPSNVYKIFTALAVKGKTLLIPDTHEAVKQAVLLAKANKPLPVLGAGSFYLVSEIRKYFYNS
ncbi:MAG: Mur ligase family protein [Treponema sp.]|nr:Mur ligase family protein [Treponema sp.]